jgi:hypothetical protein
MKILGIAVLGLVALAGATGCTPSAEEEIAQACITRGLADAQSCREMAKAAVAELTDDEARQLARAMRDNRFPGVGNLAGLN